MPNGFHDADLQAVSINYATREARFSIRVWVGYEEPHPSAAGRKPIRRAGELVVRALEALVIPSPKTLSETEGFVLDVSGSNGVATSDIQLPPLSADAFVYSFYVSNWNDFIVLAAQDAEFNWTG